MSRFIRMTHGSRVERTRSESGAPPPSFDEEDIPAAAERKRSDGGLKERADNGGEARQDADGVAAAADVGGRADRNAVDPPLATARIIRDPEPEPFDAKTRGLLRIERMRGSSNLAVAGLRASAAARTRGSLAIVAVW
mmetsp:Transcript_19462/g.39425  ORF Transcript_19462/g.39425 Transcript_19462/m.39425 type:complete len:138 (+) Transcript_19462:1189-1602(+)